MKGRKHEMSRLRRLQRHARLWIYLDLADRCKHILDRILDGNDVSCIKVNGVEHCVERSGFTAARGSADNHHAGGLMDYLRDKLETLWRQTDLVESEHAGRLGVYEYVTCSLPDRLKDNILRHIQDFATFLALPGLPRPACLTVYFRKTPAGRVHQFYGLLRKALFGTLFRSPVEKAPNNFMEDVLKIDLTFLISAKIIPPLGHRLIVPHINFLNFHCPP